MFSRETSILYHLMESGSVCHVIIAAALARPNSLQGLCCYNALSEGKTLGQALQIVSSTKGLDP